jgi:hypothetical protein
VEQELAAGLGEGQIADLVEDDGVHAGQMFGEPTLPAVASLGLEPVDEINHVVESATDPERMQLLAMAMARWVLPVPVPRPALCGDAFKCAERPLRTTLSRHTRMLSLRQNNFLKA